MAKNERVDLNVHNKVFGIIFWEGEDMYNIILNKIVFLELCKL